MVLLDLLSTNNNIIAKFQSTCNNSVLSIIDSNNNSINLSVSSNCLNIYGSNDINGGLFYKNDNLIVSNLNINNITNTLPLIFPSINYKLSSYNFQSSDNFINYNNYNVFDYNNPDSFWKSDSIFNLNGTFNTFYYSYLTYNFNNLNIFGPWVQIVLPFPISITSLYISLNNNNNDPYVIYFLGFNVNTNIWDILLNNYTIINNTININTDNYYSNFSLIITQTRGGIYVIINKIIFNASPIFSLNNKIIINKDNLYNINSIQLNKLILNNVPVSSFNELSVNIASNAILHITSNLNIVWNNNSDVAYNNSFVNRIAINKNNANASLDINGNINFNNRIITNKISINTTLTNIYNNNYIKIGTFNFNSSEYFELNLYIYDYNIINSVSFYSQSIKIHGIANINSILYSETISDVSTNILRISDVYFNYISNNSVEFFVKYNDNLDITNINPNIPTTLFSNVIYIDFLNTYNNNNNFVIPNTIQYPILMQNLKKIVKKYENIINNNIINQSSNIHNFYNTLYADNINFNYLYFSSNFFIPNSVIFNDNNGYLKSSPVSYSQLLALSNISLNPNKALIVNNNGIIETSSTSSSHLLGLSNISIFPNSAVFVNSSGILDSSSGISLNQLKGLSLLPNRIVITDNNGILNTTNFISNNIYNNIDKSISLFNFFNNSNIAFTYSNITLYSSLSVYDKINTNILNINSNITIGSSIISFNSNINKLQLNNNNIPDDIFRKISKYPISNSFSTISQLVLTEYIYTLSLLNNSSSYSNGSYIIKINSSDYLFDYEVFNLFSNNLNSFWKSSSNFNSSSFIVNKYVNGNSNYNNTLCGAYITFILPDYICLNSYIFYYSYSNFFNTINSFNLFGYDIKTDIWVLLDSRSNITSWNNNNQNIFFINNPTSLYNTFAICITKSNTISNYNFVILNSIEFYGFNNYFNNIIYNSINNSNSVFLGNNSFGISNFKPKASFSINPDLLNTPSNSLLNLNNTSNISINTGISLFNLTRPSNNSNIGIRASHILNNWNNSTNTRYDINLTHINDFNENLVLSMLSDGRVGIAMTPNISINNNYLSLVSNICIYNKNSNYIGIGVTTISNNYSIILPNSPPNVYNLLNVNSIDNNSNVFLNWVNPQNIFNTLPFCKIGSTSIITCNIVPIVLQIAGNCLIGSDNIAINNLTNNYITDNTLVVIGNIYTTKDITTDCDISYKFNIKKIYNALSKIKNINGYTFNRNDTNDLNKRYCGLIAQEVNKIMPEAIIYKHDGKMRLLYTHLIGLLVEGIKELEFKFNILIIFNLIFIFFILFKLS